MKHRNEFRMSLYINTMGIEKNARPICVFSSCTIWTMNEEEIAIVCFSFPFYVNTYREEITIIPCFIIHNEL